MIWSNDSDPEAKPFSTKIDGSIRNRGDAYRIHLQEILTRFVYRRHLPKMFTGYAHRRCLQDTLTGYAYRSSNSPGKVQIHNCFIFNILEILNLPGDTNLASPGKWLFAMILIIRWLQIKGLPGELQEQAPEA